MPSRRMHWLGAVWCVIVAIIGPSAVQAETYFWNANGTSSPAAGGAGTWDTGNARWRAGTDTGSATAWPTSGTDTAAAVFAGTAGTVTLSGSLEANSLLFSTTGYTLSSGTLALVGTTPTISSTVATATISTKLTGTQGLTKSGTGGLTLSGANTFSGPVSVSAGTLTVTSAGGLGTSTSAAVAGTLSFNSSSALTWSGSTSGAGTITKSGSGNVSLTLNGGSTIGEINSNVASGTLSLSTANPTDSVTLTQLRGVLNSRIAITSGTWNAANIGGNSATNTLRSTLTVSAATLVVSNGRYINCNVALTDGGTFRVTTDRFGFGNDFNFGSPTLEIGAGGTLDIWSTQYGSRIGAAGTNSTTLIKQTSGTAMFGVNDGSVTSNRNLLLSSGPNATDPVANTKTAYDLSGGTLFVRGTLLGNAVTGGVTNFNFRGGVLAVNAYTAANIGSSTDPTDPFANSTDIGTLVNRGGTLAPGGLGTAGRTTITGNYRVDSGALAIDIGGTAQANAFQTVSGSYDFVTVTNGSAAVGGTLAVSFIGGYTPTVSNTTTLFNVFNSTGTGADLSGTFSNLVVATSGNRRIVLADGLASMLVATNTAASAASVGGLSSVPARTVSLGGYQTANGYSGAATAWDSANAGSWTAFDPGATSSPATVASGAIARFADDTATTGVIGVSLASTRNVRGIQFASTATGAGARSYTIAQGGGGAIVLDNGGAAVTIADSSAAGNSNVIEVPLTLAGDLAVSVSGATTTLTLGGNIAGAGRAMSKTGAGALVLAGSNSYSGITSVTGGQLQVSSAGSLNSTSGITVNGAGAEFRYNSATALSAPLTLTQGTLSGSGAIGTAVSVGSGAILSPGNSPGSQAFTQGLTFGQGGQYTWEVNNWSGAAGTGYDQLVVSGSALNVAATSGSTFKIALVGLTAGNTAGAVPNFSGSVGTSFTLATSSAGITGFDKTKLSLDASGFTGNNSLPTNAGFWLTTNAGSTSLILNYAPSATYTLSAAASASVIRVGATSTITATVTSSTASVTNADSVAYGGLALSGLGSLSSTSGTLAAGQSGSGSAVFTGATAGTFSFTPSLTTANNVNIGTSANAGSSSAVTVGVFSGTGSWNNTAGGSWGSGSSADWTSAEGVAAAPGTFAGYTNTDSATFGSTVTGGTATVSLNGAQVSLATLAFNNSAARYVIATGTGSGSLTLAKASGKPVIDVVGTHEIAAAILGANGVQKTGAGKLILSGSSSYSGGTDVSAGTLAVNGSIAGNVAVAAGAVLGGSGSIAGVLSGAGLVGPGNSPGILTAGQFDPSGGLDAAFEFTALSPAYASASASLNDVLRLTNASNPFASATFTAGNVIDVYFNVDSIASGQVYEGGFFTGLSAESLLAALDGKATFNYWAKTTGTAERTYGGFDYVSLASISGITGATFQTASVTRDFGAGIGDVAGSVTQFVIVPEPDTIIFAGIGVAMAGWSLCKRRRRTP